MKSVKIFGKKTPILAVFLATVLLISTVALANAVDQEVTGETFISYAVTTPVAFGEVSPSTTVTALDVITASSDGNTITVTAADQDGGTTGALEELRYVAGTVATATGVPLEIWDEDDSVSLWAAITLTNGATLSMEADTGTVGGLWGTITITLTVS